ncbi:MAG: hypothetical protein WC616_02420 [Candidatus Omnitrophota bacterium]
MGWSLKNDTLNVPLLMNASNANLLDGFDYFLVNGKEIAHFQASETWTSVAGTQADDTTNFLIGTKSLRITENDNTGSQLYSSINFAATKDLTTFKNGAASAAGDYIYFVVYVSDVTKTVGVQLIFDTAAAYTGSNIYYYYKITELSTGWNYILAPKSAFSSSGTPNWNNINSMAVTWNSQDNAINAYVSFQLIMLLAASPTL